MTGHRAAQRHPGGLGLVPGFARLRGHGAAARVKIEVADGVQTGSLYEAGTQADTENQPPVNGEENQDERDVQDSQGYCCVTSASKETAVLNTFSRPGGRLHRPGALAVTKTW